MNKSIYYFLGLILCLSFASCDNDSPIDDTSGDNNKTEANNIKVELLLSSLSDYENLNITSATLSYKQMISQETKNEEVTIADNKVEISLLPEIYDFTLELAGTYTAEGQETSINLRGHVESQSIREKNSIELPLTKYYPTSLDPKFLIEEIYYTGSVYPETSRIYIGDQYFRITNNSDQTLYADGLCIAETTFSSSMRYEYTPNIKAEATTIQALYQVPGDGKQYPIEPGKSIIIADRALNHKVEGHPNSIDLSHADFEWYDESFSTRFADTDNPEVPNLNKIYSYSRTFWIINKHGNRSYLLLRMGTDKDTFLTDYEYDYSFILNGDREVNRTGYKVPNEWIIDAVNLGEAEKYQWNILDDALDAGYTYDGEHSKDPNRYGVSVRRKTTRLADGRTILQDTNNSTDDFIRNAQPSVEND